MPPRLKTPISSLFCRVGRHSCRTTGIGKIIMTKSVVMFMPALKNQTAHSLRQCPPLIVGSQNVAIGQHVKTAEKNAHRP
jgi:hypothetical protein